MALSSTRSQESSRLWYYFACVMFSYTTESIGAQFARLFVLTGTSTVWTRIWFSLHGPASWRAKEHHHTSMPSLILRKLSVISSISIETFFKTTSRKPTTPVSPTVGSLTYTLPPSWLIFISVSQDGHLPEWYGHFEQVEQFCPDIPNTLLLVH